MVKTISLLLLLFVSTACGPLPSFSCIFLGKDCKPAGNTNDETAIPSWVQTFTDTDANTPKTIRRQTPEQLSLTFDRQVDSSCSFVQWANKIMCSFIDFNPVAYGGVDFNVSRDRDENTKINHVLYGREEMYDKARHIASLNPGYDETSIFYDKTGFWSEADPTSVDDAPVATGELQTDGSARWAAQLEKTYWLFLSRPPDPEEVTILSEHFIAARASEEYRWTPLMAWTEVFYIIFMTMEFWHI